MPDIKITYGKLISHVFPGFILLVEIIVAIDLLSPVRICYLLLNLEWGSLLSLGMLLLFIGTILGVLIDSINHFITEDGLGLFRFRDHVSDICNFMIRKTKKKSNPIYYSPSVIDKWPVYQELVIEEHMYYYEAYFNIFFAFLPLPFITNGILCRLQLESYATVAICLICVVMVILFIESWVTYKEYCKIDAAF